MMRGLTEFAKSVPLILLIMFGIVGIFFSTMDQAPGERSIVSIAYSAE